MRIQSVIVFCLIGASARAGQICNTATLPSAMTNWSQTISVPRFDPALGTLNQMTIALSSTLTGSISVENTNPTPAQITSTLSVTCILHRPDNTPLVGVAPAITIVDNLPAFDGVIDFAGTSGVMHPGLSFPGSITGVGGGSDLVLFTGPAGNPGTITLPVTAMNMSTAVGPGPIITSFPASANALVTICYDYTPTATSFCAGDGSGTACPCGNASAVGAGQGCLNSTGTAARLSGSGASSVSNDTFVLTCQGLPATTFVLFFQGTAQQSGGAGSVFGDGLRCVAGTVVRLHTVVASGGVAAWPQTAGATISGTGSVPANSTRHYQAWYRNAAAFCTPSTFNLSQGLSVTWQS